MALDVRAVRLTSKYCLLKRFLKKCDFGPLLDWI